MRIHIVYHERKDFLNFWEWLLYRWWSVNKNGDREWGFGFFGCVVDNEPKGGND